jgi:hypothetical protein
MDDADDPEGSAPGGSMPAAQVGAKCAFMGRVDHLLAAAGYAVPLPPPAPPEPPPPPALTFEAWAELSARYASAPAADLGAALAARGLTFEVWKRLDAEYSRALSDDVRAGRRDRAAIYEARSKEEEARRGGARAEAVPSVPVLLAPAHLSGTNEAPDLPAVVARIGRMPFVPPPPAPAAPGKRPSKTKASEVTPNRVGGETMDLAAILQRPTPNLPFAGTASDAGAVYVPPLGARQYLSLRVELELKTAPREETLKRYRVPTEGSFRALEEHWRHPARRVELERAVADFGVMLRGLVLG